MKIAKRTGKKRRMATLPIQQQSDIIAGQPKRKPGRPKMPYGNKSRRAQKGIYLSDDTREMLVQASIVLGISESAFAENAIRTSFMQQYQQHRQVFGETFWNESLERAHHPQRLKLR